MSAYPILLYPDKRLRQAAASISRFDAELQAVIAKMFDTMYAAKGIGLAATQVNIHQRLTVMDVPQIRREAENEAADDTSGAAEQEIMSDKLVLINPEIIDHSEELAEYEEGCLSLPGQYASVWRPAQIRVRYQDEHGERQERDASGLLAVCIQHEIDHLNGKLFIDYLSRMKRERLEKKLAKYLKEQESKND